MLVHFKSLSNKISLHRLRVHLYEETLIDCVYIEYIWKRVYIWCHLLFFDLIGSCACHLSRVCLGLAAMPQVDEGLADTQHHHGDAGAQATAVAHHLQQVALHCHLPSHAVQAPVIWEEEGEEDREGRVEKEMVRGGVSSEVCAKLKGKPRWRLS